MNKHIKTRVDRESNRYIDISIRGRKFLVCLDLFNDTAPNVYACVGKGSTREDVRIPKTDPRYVPAVRIALSALYRVDLTV